MPNTIRTIEKEAFYGCSSLKAIYIPDGIEKIPSFAFAFCKSLENINFPSSLTTISDDAFHECTSLKSLAFNEGLTYIGTQAFYGCNGIVDIKLPSTLTQIGGWAFNSAKITSISLPANLSKIGSYAFQHCPLVEVTCLNRNVPTFETNIFANDVYLNGVLYVPSDLVEDFIQKTPWSDFFNVRGIEVSAAFETIGDGSDLFELHNGCLHINGDSKQPVTVYGLDGKLIYRGNERDIKLNSIKAAIVQYSGKSYKVLL
jgi:hypothetical protein